MQAFGREGLYPEGPAWGREPCVGLSTGIQAGREGIPSRLPRGAQERGLQPVGARGQWEGRKGT